MNEETLLPSEVPTDQTSEPTSPAGESIPAETLDWTVATEATETVEVVTVQVIQDVGSEIAHTNLFGSFLVCGTLIGLALLRTRYGS